MAESSIVFGFHAVNSLVSKHPGKIDQILYFEQRQDGRIKGLIKTARSRNISCQAISKLELEKQVGSDAVHQGVVALIKQDRLSNEGDLDKLLEQADQNALFLILDGVTDPHNLGACLRSANAAGVAAIIMAKDKSAPLTPVAKKVACGAAEFTPVIRVTNLVRTMKLLQDAGIWLVGTAGETDKTIYQSDYKGPIGLVMGAEEKGMRRLTRETCDELVKIPMLGEVTSLNVSVATGVCLFEIVRQRSQ